MEHDAATRLWASIEQAHENFSANRRELGQLFFQLRNLYSERGNSAAGRLTSGHGSFQAEIKQRGYKPNRIREWINDHEVEIGLRSPAESTRAKRAARRDSSAEYRRGFREGAGSSDIFGEIAGISQESSAWSAFAKILSHSEARSAYRSAAKRLHPDHAGDADAMGQLNQLWEQLEALYIAKEARPTSETPEDTARVN
jgi:hypothetical protein